MTVTIRPAAKRDADTIADFNRAMAAETEDIRLDPATAAAGVTNLLDHADRGFYLIAEQAGRPVGQLMVTFEWSDWRNGFFWWVQSVYVAPEARRRGVFSSLLASLAAMADGRPDVVGLRLYVHRHNAGARAAYERLGWRHTDYDLYEYRPTAGRP